MIEISVKVPKDVRDIVTVAGKLFISKLWVRLLLEGCLIFRSNLMKLKKCPFLWVQKQQVLCKFYTGCNWYCWRPWWLDRMDLFDKCCGL